MKNLLLCLLCSSIIPLSYLGGINCLAQTIEEAPSEVEATDVYDLTLMLRVPQVYNNAESTGYRKYGFQKIKGELYIKWLVSGGYKIEMGNLENKTFKVKGVRVAYEWYDGDLVYPRLNWIGNNKTEKFTVPTLYFSVALDPSYAISTVNEDNSFYLILSGIGVSTYKKELESKLTKTITGYVVGTQGCGCTDYGHKSPTRVGALFGPSEKVDDVVATMGSWTAKWRRRDIW